MNLKAIPPLTTNKLPAESTEIKLIILGSQAATKNVALKKKSRVPLKVCMALLKVKSWWLRTN
jgi:hypothetical protein